MNSNNDDQVEIDNLTQLFFSIFDNRNMRIPDLDKLKDLFIKEGIIINNTTGDPLIYNLDSFIAPRKKMLIDGSLTDFNEGEISHETTIYKNIAQRFCKYEKSGKLSGEDFKTEGVKSIQFIKELGQWKISTVVWSDKV